MAKRMSVPSGRCGSRKVVHSTLRIRRALLGASIAARARRWPSARTRRAAGARRWLPQWAVAMALRPPPSCPGSHRGPWLASRSRSHPHRPRRLHVLHPGRRGLPRASPLACRPRSARQARQTTTSPEGATVADGRRTEGGEKRKACLTGRVTSGSRAVAGHEWKINASSGPFRRARSGLQAPISCGRGLSRDHKTTCTCGA